MDKLDNAPYIEKLVYRGIGIKTSTYAKFLLPFPKAKDEIDLLLVIFGVN